MMRFDLSTLYCLVIGTLLLSAGMTLWERQTLRTRELQVLASGYSTLALGCLLAQMRGVLPGALGHAVSNLVIVSGYLLVLHGVALLNDRQYRAFSFGVLALVALAWGIVGRHWEDGFWSYVTAFPIALICAATALEMRRSEKLRELRSWRVVIALTALHALVYAGRSTVLPAVAMLYDPSIATLAAKLTMYEGVLYSVGLPMALLALIREEAHEHLLRASHSDFLTGLGNRRWFFERGECLVQAAGADRPLALLAFDLDHFKAINDRHGHATGDEVLKLFAQTLRAVAGRETVLARIGGEEFAALLPGHTGAHAKSIGQDVARRFAQGALEPEGTDIEATVSIGVAACGRDGTSLAELLSAADRALYIAKAQGRNRVVFAPSPALEAA
jgi:diguanylate cyclase (GGDEF)-like protein